jgi:hypothetical protein
MAGQWPARRYAEPGAYVLVLSSSVPERHHAGIEVDDASVSELEQPSSLRPL